MSLIIRGEVAGQAGALVRLKADTIASIEAARVSVPTPDYDAGGGAIVPLLWDHHIHLRSLSARDRSLDISGIRSLDHLGDMLREAKPDATGWVRAVGYDDTVIGALQRSDLDRLTGPDVPLRLQHRSGHQWIVNSAGLRLLGLPANRADSGVFWGDLPRSASLDVASLRRTAERLRGHGVYGVTDMTPDTDPEDILELRNAVAGLLTVRSYGGVAARTDGVKLIAPDHGDFDPEQLVSALRRARPMPVAIHSVTAETLAITTWALRDTVLPGDRVEHAFLAPAPLRADLAELGVGVGAHPGFIRTHGDRVLQHYSAYETLDYQPLSSWALAGVPLFGGTDAPFSHENPWQAMQSAVDRRTALGETLNPAQSLTPEAAFALFTRDGLTQPEPGPPSVFADGSADFLILDRPWSEARTDLTRVRIQAVVRHGKLQVGKPEQTA